MSKGIEHELRKTKETEIEISVNMGGGDIAISTGLPFFDHMLHAMAFHGGFGLKIDAAGDIEVDPHHLVEDTGIVLGKVLKKVAENHGPIKRFGHSVIPMDDALSEVTIDAGGRGYAVMRADFPQEYSGNFHMHLFKEFFTALASSGLITMHLECRYGENSHHMAESLFKALGKAFKAAFEFSNKGILSTKGKI